MLVQHKIKEYNKKDKYDRKVLVAYPSIPCSYSYLNYLIVNLDHDKETVLALLDLSIFIVYNTLLTYLGDHLSFFGDNALNFLKF